MTRKEPQRDKKVEARGTVAQTEKFPALSHQGGIAGDSALIPVDQTS